MIRGQHQTKPAALAGSDFSLPIGSQSEFLISEWKPETGMAGVQGNDKFCLKWNDFENNVSTAFQELREDRDFFDVTLACEGNQLEAHKVGWMDICFLICETKQILRQVILSACSPFFRGVLKRNPHNHPLLYLRGIKYESILAVLNFMYNGEVNIAQAELSSFLAVAEDLQVA